MTGLRALRVAPFGAVALSALVEGWLSASSGIAAQALAGRTGETRTLRGAAGGRAGEADSHGLGLLLAAGFAELAAWEAGAS